MGGFEDHGAVTGDWMTPNVSPRSIFLSMMGENMVSGSVVDDKNQQSLYENEADGEIDSNVSMESRASSRSNLVERMAARAGFHAPPRLNTESIRQPSDVPKSSSDDFLMTIPPGLSPTTLLESPVFLHNSQIMPSPTTGKFCFAPSGSSGNSVMITEKSRENSYSYHDSSSFTFKPVSESGPLSYLNPKNKPVYASDFGVQSFPGAAPFQSDELKDLNGEKSSENGKTEVVCHSGSSPSSLDAVSDQCCGSPYDDDGYSWRKYGQKQVKGSDHPRSYYKCTVEKCPVKKKLERCHEGDVTEIVYNGAHNHPKPPSDPSESINPPVWKPNISEWSTALDGSSTYSNEEGDEGTVRGGMSSLGYDGDESESKRRRHEASSYITEMSVVNRAIREPRVVVQTMSEVDILDDGYRWRKYGQKVVKGNPNPRSYYKCTSPGCNVRKHVERASHDLKSVITTYEGKHNHDVPAARNSSHVNSGGSNNQQPVQVSSHVHRPELSHMLAASFRRPEIGSYGPIYGFGMNPNLLGVGPMSTGGYIMPKPEPKMEPMTNTTDSSGLVRTDGSSSVYQQFVSRMPLGPM